MCILVVSDFIDVIMRCVLRPLMFVSIYVNSACLRPICVIIVARIISPRIGLSLLCIRNDVITSVMIGVNIMIWLLPVFFFFLELLCA